MYYTVRPRWTVEPTDKQFAQGSDAKVDCKADGFPQPTISWQKAIGKLVSKYISDFKWGLVIFLLQICKCNVLLVISSF